MVAMHVVGDSKHVRQWWSYMQLKNRKPRPVIFWKEDHILVNGLWIFDTIRMHAWYLFFTAVIPLSGYSALIVSSLLAIVNVRIISTDREVTMIFRQSLCMPSQRPQHKIRWGKRAYRFEQLFNMIKQYLTRMPAKQQLRWLWTRKPLTYRESTCCFVSIYLYIYRARLIDFFVFSFSLNHCYVCAWCISLTGR